MKKFVLHELCSQCQQNFAFVIIDFGSCEMVQLFFDQYNAIFSLVFMRSSVLVCPKMSLEETLRE